MQSAQVAAKALDGLCPISIVDSKSASMGIGNLVIDAARRAKEGADLTTIVQDVEARRERQHILAALDTLEYLRKGGRIGGARAMLGSMLSIKPIISVVDGAVDEAGKVRTRGKALQFILDRLPAQGIEQIAVLHAGAPDVDDFLGKLRRKHRRRRDRRRRHRTRHRGPHGAARASASRGSTRAESTSPDLRGR